MRLTDLVIRALPVPKTGQKFYIDDTLAGFGCRISCGGTRTFVLLHGRHPRRRTTIGRYPIVSLAQARQKAKELLAEQTLGKDRPKTITLSEALETFLATHSETNHRPRTRKETERLLRKHFLSRVGGKQLSAITTDDLTQITDKLSATPSEATHAHRAASTLFKWATRRRYISHSPLEGVSLPSPDQKRDRLLTDEEIQRIWNACEGTMGSITRLLILSGQRKLQISAMQREWVRTDTFEFPPEIMKGAKSHTVPFAELTRRVLSEIPNSNSAYLFPSRWDNEKHFVGWQKLKAAMDKKAEVSSYTLHDFRRYFSSTHARISTPLHLTERLLAHTSGTISGVSAIYNRYQFADELRTAVERYEAHLLQLLVP